jgi:hypothetical protein
VLDNNRSRVELVAQLTVNTLLPCAVSITTILIGDVVEHAMKSPWWFSHHAINLFITINKNHILRYMMPVRTDYVNSLSPQRKRTVTVALRYVTQIEEVSIVNQLTVTMKPSTNAALIFGMSTSLSLLSMSLLRWNDG